MHRALADPHRARLVGELRDAEQGLGAQELAERLGLHPNTIRWHLGVLADAGIVSSRVEERSTPGRPRVLYTLASDDADTESYRLLGTILHGVVSELDDGAARAESSGRAWGRYLVERPAPNEQLAEDEAVGRIVELLALHGFRPQADGREIRMRRCPYRELAPGAVCSVHEGLIRGALDELDAGVTIDRLEAFVEPGVCVATLRRRRATNASA